VIGRRCPQLRDSIEGFHVVRALYISPGGGPMNRDEMKDFDFQQLVELLPLVVYVDQPDEKSTPIYVSPQIERLLGYTAEEWVADPDLYVKSIHPDDREWVLAGIAKRNRRLTPAPSSDYRLIARDGQVVWVQDDELVVAGEDGGRVTVHGYIQDISRRKRDTMRLEILADVLSLANEELPPQTIVERTAARLAEALGEIAVTFVEIADGPAVRPRYSSRPTAFHGDVPLIPQSLRALESGPLVVDDVLEADWLEPAWPALAALGVRGAVDVPLRRNGRLVAVLWFDTPEPHAWSSAEVRLLSEVAAQLAVVLERAEAREQRLRAEVDLRNRERILEAVSRSAEILLSRDSLDDAMLELMAELGEATGVHRAYVFENVPGPAGAPYAMRRVIWTQEGWKALSDDPRLAHVRPAPHFDRWADVLGRGEVLTAKASELPEDERAPLLAIGTRSIVGVPVFVEDAWWGFLGFEDCEQERDWSAAETDALRAAAGSIAAAVRRRSTERDLARRDEILQAMSDAAEQLLAEPDWRLSIDELLRRLGLAAGVSRAYLFQCGFRADGKRVASQLNEWAAPGISAELDNPEMQDMCFEEVGLARVEELSARNDLYAGIVADFPPGERALLEAQGIRSIMTVPIFVEGSWWGFIGFDDCVSDRVWSAAETDALRTAATLVAAAIERERSEAVLREHEQKLRAVFDTALDAIFITDDERRYVDVNPAGCAFLGVARRDLVGRRLDEFLPPEQRAGMDAQWRRFLDAPSQGQEWETLRADGTVRLAEASTHPNFLPGLHIAFLRDITERRRLEAELLTAQKLDSLGRLAGGVAHDFNNLLTGISGYASLLLERANGDGELRRDLNEIKRAADRAAELTKQLLAFGRRQVLKPRPLDLNAVLADTGLLLRRLLGDLVELELHPGDDLGTVRADPGQIEQVIVNLAVNARHAMPDGGTLTIATRNAGDHVELVVGDTGVGMDEATRAQVFEPFFTTREEGVGLGLASVHGIVHQSGGEVTVESAPGVGTTFVVRLPRVADMPEPAAPAPEPEPARGTGTILLVEDEDVVRELARRVLERQGYTVLACANGADAVALADADVGRIDLLLTDVVMPGLRGYEVAQRVAASRPEIKILYMSGYAEDALVGRATINGSALIEKPFVIDALTRRVRETLEA
jgi:two-component system, cell cycle sensor histidine kinase and response regulator CckA